MEKSNFSIMRIRVSMAVVVVLSMLSAGCAGTDFDEEKAKNIVETKAFRLEGEQVSLTPEQVECGVRAELWEPRVESSPGHSSCHLTQQGRDFKFSDDVITEPNFRLSYAQVKGEFALQVFSAGAVKNAPDGMKTGEFKVGAKIHHPCFSGPLLIMGVKKGVFREDAPVVFRFQLTPDGWAMDQLLH